MSSKHFFEICFVLNTLNEVQFVCRKIKTTKLKEPLFIVIQTMFSALQSTQVQLFKYICQLCKCSLSLCGLGCDLKHCLFHKSKQIYL